MTGAEHARAAEQFLDRAALEPGGMSAASIPQLLRALVHACLAAAAALAVHQPTDRTTETTP